ncbi:MAG: class I SAM-dependent RNA methyltransferase, partial [Saprospiraceae bacterium]
AAMIAMNMPCQINRKLFGFMSWRNFDNTLWQKVIRQAKSGIDNDISLKIVGFDNQQNAVIAAQKNIAALGLQDKISVHRKSFELLEPPFASGIIITNPPYHERLKDENDEALYGEIGSRLKHFYSGYSVWIFSGFEAGIKAIGLKPSKKIKLLNGAIECKFLQFELYAGSKKDKSVIN